MVFKKVSVIVPVLNEEKYIKNCIESILMQDYPKDRIEILFIDGDSEDKTREIIENYCYENDFIKILSNPKKTVQYALNIGIENSTGEYIVRMDAHAQYERDYISQCVFYLLTTGAANVGGPTVVEGKTHTQKIIAAAYNSSFALGGSKHYKSNYEGFGDTVAWGAFYRKYLIDIGMYDENLPRSEDDDLNFRITKNGGKIFITPKIKSVYYPKDSFSGLFDQYYNYGKWKVAFIKKHRKPSRLAHLVPMLFVAYLILGSIFSCFLLPVAFAFFSILTLYFLMNIYFSFKSKKLFGIKSRFGLIWAHFIMHFSYGLGFWSGIFTFWNKKFSQEIPKHE